jgi:predicted chitinase
MDAATLVKVEPGLSLSRAQALIAYTNDAMIRCGCTDRKSASMFLAQVGAESISLQYQQEMGSLSYLQGQPYWPFIGRTFIQVTWKGNYERFGYWCVGQRLLTDPEYFVKNPGRLADDRWAWLGAVWYLTVERPSWITYAKAGDVPQCTLLINGGYNGLAGRQSRYNLCYSLGNAILPTKTGAPVTQQSELTLMQFTGADVKNHNAVFLTNGIHIRLVTGHYNSPSHLRMIAFLKSKGFDSTLKKTANALGSYGTPTNFTYPGI